LCCHMNRRRGLWWLPVMFVTGQWHEAAGVPFACGLVLYLWLNRGRHPLNVINRWLSAAFIAGAAASIVSPAILHRAAADNMPDERLWYMLLTSAWCVGLLLIAIIVMALCGRQTLRRLIKSQWIVFAVAALVGLAVCAYSGSYGRTGWFAQISAWIALCGLLNAVKVTPENVNRYRLAGIILSPIVAAGVLICSIGLTRYQLQLNRQCRDIIRQYRENPEGIVFTDLITPSQAPSYMMGRAWGWIGQYDNWHRYLIERTYSGPGVMKPLTILPERLRSLNPADTLRRHVIAGHTVTYPAAYDTTYNNAYDPARPPRVFAFIGHDNRIYYRRKFIYKGAYGIIDSPADLAPGERYPNINLQLRNLPADTTRFLYLPPVIQ
ncbi:MAG: hypothetical protein K2M03_06410, partial [Muribaculaceae bacterium]|nr:hypothetical protein [Muribaculaceae bacterium]